MDKSLAVKLVSEKLAGMPIPGDFLLIDDRKTIETDFGWIFFYNSRLFLETQNQIHRVAGNGPVFVNRVTESVTFYGSDKPLETLISEYKNNS